MAQVTETKTFMVKGWPGGYNVEDYEHLRSPDEFDACDFNLGPRGEAVIRAGLLRLAEHDSWTGTPPEARLASLFYFTPDAGLHKYLIAVDLDGKVWRSADGPASPLSACKVVAGTQINLGTPPVVPSGATLGGIFVLSCEDDDAYYWPGTAGDTWVKVTDHTLDDNGTSATWEFPVSSTTCSGWARMWAAGLDANPSRLFWSGALGTTQADGVNAAGPWNWPATNWVDINPEDGGEITRIFPFGQAIIAFKGNSTYALVGAGDPSTARLYPIHGNIGCTLPGSVAESTGKLFWATDDGVYQYDGSGVTRIDRKVRSLMASLAGGTYAKWVTGYAAGERYHLHFPIATTGTEAYHFVYDTELQAWEFHTDGGWGAALVSDQAYVTRWGGIYTLGGNSGYDAICSAAGTLDTKVTVPCYLKTSWLPPPDQRTGSKYRVRRIDLYLERPAVSADITCAYHVRLYSDYNETAKVAGYTLNLDTLEPLAESFTVTLPGYSGLVDSFRLEVAPVGADGEERIGLNGVSFMLSERAAKRGPYSRLPSGVTVEP